MLTRQLPFRSNVTGTARKLFPRFLSDVCPISFQIAAKESCFSRKTLKSAVVKSGCHDQQMGTEKMFDQPTFVIMDNLTDLKSR